jgi:class 3 adenylate cyclase
MGLKTDLRDRVDDILSVAWNTRDGRVVPSTDQVNLSNGAVKLDAVYVYADLADSTRLARDFDRRTAARVVRSYLYCMARLVVARGGEIRSFDGDRVMGIFIGDNKRTNAAKCCLEMKWAFTEIIRPKVEAKYPSLKTGGYTLEHSAGADMGEVLMVRAGVRNSNDLISIGAAPNIAAVLSDIRSLPYRSFITSAVYTPMHESAKTSNGKAMWEASSVVIKGKSVPIHRSLWGWVING